MKSFSTMRGAALLLMLFAAVAAGCGGSSGGSSETADVNGLWTNYHTPAGGTEQEPEIWKIERLGTTDSIAVTDSVNATSDGTVSGSSITITKTDGSDVYTLTGTVSGNTMSGTYSGTDGSSGTWRMVKVQLISAATTTATIPVNGTTTFAATAENYDDSTVLLSSGTYSSLTWTSSDTSVAAIDIYGVATGKKAGVTSITATYGGMTSAGVTLTVTASGGGGATSGTLTINLDLSSVATVTTAPAIVSALVYTAGVLVAESPASFKITNKTGSFVAKATANPSVDAVLEPGQYTMYILVDDNGNGTMDVDEHGRASTVTINGNITQSLLAVTFVQTVEIAVAVTGSSVPDGKGMRCDWLAPGGAWQVDLNTSTVFQGFSLAIGNTFLGGSVTTDANSPLIPTGKYDLHCWVDMDGNNAKNTGDFFGTVNTPTPLIETGTPISLTVVP